MTRVALLLAVVCGAVAVGASSAATSASLRLVPIARGLDSPVLAIQAPGEPSRIYVVEPTGPIEDDPNLTDQRFRGNPTKSFRSRSPLRVVGEVTDWQGHDPAVIQAMKDGLARLDREGVEAIDD